MSPRSYRLGKRADGVERTRSRILAVTRELLADDGYPSHPIDEVARRGGVSRATVYHQFGSKTGLLEAVVQDIQQRAGQSEIVRMADVPDPVEALRYAFQAGCRFWAAEHVLIRKLTGLATIDREIRTALATVEHGRLPLLTHLVGRLQTGGRLSASCPPPAAIDVLWLLSSFEAFDQLFTGRQLDVEAAAAVLTGLAVRQLIA